MDCIAWSRDGDLVELALDRDGKWKGELRMAGVLGSMDACAEP